MADNKKYTDNFKTAIQTMLTAIAEKDELFAKSFAKPDKSIEECCNYVLTTVQKSGVQGYTDEEVYGIAMHYYDEDDIKGVKPINCQVVVNHTVQLTDEEVAEAREKARKEVFNQEANKMRSKPKPSVKPSEAPKVIQSSLFE